MRSRILTNQVFFQGIVAGAALAGVAFLTFEAVRRTLSARSEAVRLADRPRIDGARAINPIDLDLQVPQEARSTPRHLESEGPDPAIVSQRW